VLPATHFRSRGRKLMLVFEHRMVDLVADRHGSRAAVDRPFSPSSLCRRPRRPAMARSALNLGRRKCDLPRRAR
jgi:hypothetical protein